MRRDPRSLLELRRLAYRVPRNEDARLVLIDALYETYPKMFDEMIETARYHAFSHPLGLDEERREFATFFIPQRLQARRHRRGVTFRNPFLNVRAAYVFDTTKEWERDVRTLGPDYEDAVLVYRTRGAL